MVSSQQYAACARLILDQTLSRASGAGLPGRVNGGRPADKFFVGSLGPRPGPGEGNAFVDSTSPSAMGVQFYAQNLGEIVVDGSFAAYTTAWPTFEEAMAAARETNDPTIELPPIFVRSYVNFKFKLKLRPGRFEFPCDTSSIAAAAYGRPPGNARNYRVARSALSKAHDFSQELAKLNVSTPVTKVAAQVTVDVAQDALRGFRVQVRLCNETMATPEGKRLGRDNFEEPYIFETKLCIHYGQIRLVPMQLQLSTRDYRYDPRIWVEGFNAAAHVDTDSSTIIVTAAPIYEQPRLTYKQGRENLRFAHIATNFEIELQALLAEMRDYLKSWESQLESQPRDDATNERRHSMELFRAECNRVADGIDCITRDPKARAAFAAMLRTFGLLWQQKDPQASWRRFQLAFIVSVIGDLAHRESANPEDLSVVDVLWFPTGGGKTEAYLALVIWQAFYDRLRGKRAGVTAMMRFPLRLLTLQQMQRVVEAIAAAESVRSADAAFAGDEFKVGFLVGQGATENKLSDDTASRFREELKLPPEKRIPWVRRHLVIVECPYCHQKTIDLRITDNNRLDHFCTSKSCAKTAPLIVIDDEIYRYLPTLLVGTIDKLALIGQNIRWRQLLGVVDCKCPEHGYGSGGKCPTWGCKEKVQPVRLFDAAPALQIQDELHLLREEVGVVTGHYETTAHEIAARNGLACVKIVASTATIQDHDRQTMALYGRHSRQFPQLGPDLYSSFYVDVEDYPQRIFVGIMPRRLTHINALMQLIRIEQEVIQELSSRQLAQSIVPDIELDGILDFYEVVVTYTLRRIDQDRVDASIISQVDPSLIARKLLPLNNQPMTGGTSSEEVISILDKLEKPPQDRAQRIRSVTATSMISHGVDVDRLNVMNFFGIPNLTAEYIQSSSRVGRRHCGVVFVVFQAHKERERSYYQTFAKYHEFLNRLVEPVPLNRWASRALYYTMPGLIMAILFGIFGPRWHGSQRRSLWSAKEVLKAFDQGAFDVDEVAQTLAVAIRAEPMDRENVVSEARRLIQRALETARLAESKAGFGEGMPPGPMRSLRDVEEAFPVSVLGPNMWFAEHD
jgi:hypothetical protein